MTKRISRKLPTKMDLESKAQICAAQWDIFTPTERYALLAGCLGVGGHFYELSKLQWTGIPMEFKVELVLLDWEAMLGRQIKSFRENPNY